MSKITSKDIGNYEGDSVKISVCNKNVTDCFKDDDLNESSQELFSDDEEETNKVNTCTPKESDDDYSFDNSFNLSSLCSHFEEDSSGQAVIPKTPISLAPFISKIDEPWTSELETPDAKWIFTSANAQVSSTGRVEYLKNARNTNQQLTPVLKNNHLENVEYVSPILTNSKRKIPKRQIFKSNTFENLEITQSSENILKDEESLVNVEEVKKCEAISSPNQEKVSNNLNVISTHSNEKSSPKCLDRESNNFPKNSQPIGTQLKASSSAGKSLGDIVREVKKSREKKGSLQIIDAGISENDLLMNVIQLEHASKFSYPVKEIQSSISEMGLVPFSEFFKDIDDEPFNETSIKEEEDISETRPSPKETSESEEEHDIYNLQFSQWLYKSDSKMSEHSELNAEPQDDKEKMSQVRKKDFEIAAEIDKDLLEDCFSSTKIADIGRKLRESEKMDTNKLQKDKLTLQEMESFDFDKDFREEIRLQDLKKSSNLEAPKPISCGFSTAGGKSIQISKEKLKSAEKIYKDIDNIDNVFDLNTKNSTISELPSCSKSTSLSEENPLSDMKSNFSSGFATASGKNISVSHEKLLNAKKMYSEIELSTTEKLIINKENQLKCSRIKSPTLELTNKTPMTNNLLNQCSIVFDLQTKNATTVSELPSCSKSTSLNEENPLSDMKSNFNSGFATASGKNISVSHEKLLNAKKMYSEVELSTIEKPIIGKENLLKCSPIESKIVSLSNNSKTPMTNNLLNKSSSHTKRKIIEENTRHSKRFKALNIGISRNSFGHNKNFTNVIVNKNVSKVPVENVSSNELKIVENVSRCDLTVPNVENAQCGDLTKSETSKTSSRNTFSLPLNSTSNVCLKINQRRSLPIPFKNNENCQPLSRNNLLIKTANRSPERLIAKSSELESPPFYGFNSQKLSTTSDSPLFHGFSSPESANSTALLLKSKVLLEEVKSSLKHELFSTQTTGGKETESISKSAKATNTEVSKKKEELEEHRSKLLSYSKTAKMMPNKNSDNLIKKTVCLIKDVLGQKIELSNTKLSQIKHKSCNRTLLWNSIMKRGIDDVDGDTPLGRRNNSKSKKPKHNLDLHGRKLFSEDSVSDDETENNAPKKLDYLDQPGTSSSMMFQEKGFHDSNSTVLTYDSIISDTVASKELFEPFLKETENCYELKDGFEQNIGIQEESNSSDEVPRSPILGKAKLKKKRRSRMYNSMINKSGSVKDEKFDSDINSDSTMSLQTFGSVSAVHNSEILEKRIAAAFELDKIISRKKRDKPRPIKGTFLFNRDEYKDSRISLYELANGSAPTLRSFQELKERGINPDILNVTASTAEFYKFPIDNIDRSAQSNLVSLKVGDGGILVFDESGSAGVEEFETAFEASPGVDPSLLPQGWVRNHYRWIVWKLASMDRMKLGSSDVPRMLTPDRVMKDLKYRYDREIDRSQRPAIRKILEKDDVPSKRMVLCISTLTESLDNETEERDPKILLRTPRWKVEVTDGWYSLPASFDTAMVKHIIDKKIQEGTKIVTYGAELLNCDQGCFPLEKPGNVCLKIHTNSTRRARWDAKLGYQLKSGPITSSLKAVDPNGGFISQLNVIVSRIYPIMYREKTADGQTIYRNEKNEEKAIMDYERECHSKAEAIYAKAEKKFEGSNHDSSEEDSAESFAHYDSFGNLSESQKMKLLHNREAKQERLKMKIDEELKANLPPARQVVPVQKVRVVDGETCAILTIWSKSDDVSIFKEGGCYSIFNINTYGRRNEELHLTASRQAIFKPISISNKIYPCRTFTPLKEISVPGFDPPYCELDTIGIVSWIGNTPHGMKNFEAICLAYPNEDSSSSTYLSILFWQGISSYGFSNIFTVGSLIACTNLEIRKTRNASGLPLCYCSERTVFTKNPRQAHLLSAFKALKNQITDAKAYATTCGKDISTLIEKKLVSRVSSHGILNSADRSSGNHSPHFMVAKTPMDVDTPAKSSVNQKRIEQLSRYGHPPELSPIVFNNSSNVRSSFRPVFRTPNSLKSTNTRPDTT